MPVRLERVPARALRRHVQTVSQVMPAGQLPWPASTPGVQSGLHIDSPADPPGCAPHTSPEAHEFGQTAPSQT
jgi:hypothetical protein